VGSGLTQQPIVDSCPIRDGLLFCRNGRTDVAQGPGASYGRVEEGESRPGWAAPVATWAGCWPHVALVSGLRGNLHYSRPSQYGVNVAADKRFRRRRRSGATLREGWQFGLKDLLANKHARCRIELVEASAFASARVGFLPHPARAFFASGDAIIRPVSAPPKER
jgi:hypothetical protein